jgi:hypothetical protein
LPNLQAVRPVAQLIAYGLAMFSFNFISAVSVFRALVSNVHTEVKGERYSCLKKHDLMPFYFTYPKEKGNQVVAAV